MIYCLTSHARVEKGSTMSTKKTILCQQFRDDLANIEKKLDAIDPHVLQELSEDAEGLSYVTFEYSTWQERQYKTDYIRSLDESPLRTKIRKIEEATSGLSGAAETFKNAYDKTRAALDECLDLVVPGVGRDVKLRNLTPTGDKPDLTVRRQRRPQRSCS
jgi:hypothetical protein